MIVVLTSGVKSTLCRADPSCSDQTIKYLSDRPGFLFILIVRQPITWWVMLNRFQTKNAKNKNWLTQSNCKCGELCQYKNWKIVLKLNQILSTRCLMSKSLEVRSDWSLAAQGACMIINLPTAAWSCQDLLKTWQSSEIFVGNGKISMKFSCVWKSKFLL